MEGKLNYPSIVSCVSLSFHLFFNIDKHTDTTHTHSQVKLADGRLVKGRQRGPDVVEPTVQKAKGFDLP